MRKLLLVIVVGSLLVYWCNTAGFLLDIRENGVRIGFPFASISGLTFLFSSIVLILLSYLVIPVRDSRLAFSRSVAEKKAGEDEEMLRDINRTLETMEKRIQSLETILLEREARVKDTANL